MNLPRTVLSGLQDVPAGARRRLTAWTAIIGALTAVVITASAALSILALCGGTP